MEKNEVTGIQENHPEICAITHRPGEVLHPDHPVQGEGSAFSAGHEGRSVCLSTLTAQGTAGNPLL